MRKPRKFTTAFQAQVARAALKDEKPLAVLCRAHQLCDTIVIRWPQQLLEHAANICAGQTPTQREQQKMDELQCLIAQLTVALSAAKKLSPMLR